MAGHAGPLAVHRDGDPGVLLVRCRRTFCEWWLGAGCVKDASPVLRGGGAQSWTSGGGNLGWGASLTNTPRARRRILPRSPRTVDPPDHNSNARGPALLTLTSGPANGSAPARR